MEKDSLQKPARVVKKLFVVWAEEVVFLVLLQDFVPVNQDEEETGRDFISRLTYVIIVWKDISGLSLVWLVLVSDVVNEGVKERGLGLVEPFTAFGTGRLSVRVVGFYLVNEVKVTVIGFESLTIKLKVCSIPTG